MIWKIALGIVLALVLIDLGIPLLVLVGAGIHSLFEGAFSAPRSDVRMRAELEARRKESAAREAEELAKNPPVVWLAEPVDDDVYEVGKRNRRVVFYAKCPVCDARFEDLIADKARRMREKHMKSLHGL